MLQKINEKKKYVESMRSYLHCKKIKKICATNEYSSIKMKGNSNANGKSRENMGA